MIDTTKSVKITYSGIDIVSQGDHPGQLFTFGKVLLVRKDRCIVLVSAGNLAGKKIDMPLTFPAVVNGVTYHANIPEQDAKPAVVAAVKIRTTGGETKISRCRALYAELRATHTREQIVARFISEVGCTPAGATTYFLTCVKG